VIPGKVKVSVAENKSHNVAKKIIAIYSQSDLANDPRVHRQIEILSTHYRIVAFGKNPPAVSVDKFCDIAELIGIPEDKKISFAQVVDYVREFGLARFFSIGFMYTLSQLPILPAFQKYWQTKIARGAVARRLSSTECDLIIANDDTALAVCTLVKGGRKLLFDAHEYTPGQFPHRKRYLGQRTHARYQLKKCLPSCDVVTTVGSGIAGLYERMFGVSCSIITNAPSYRVLSPVLRDDGKIRLVHHGLAARKRDLETMVDVLRLLDSRFTLDFFLVPQDPAYYSEIRKYTQDDPRITFNEPVPMRMLPETLNAFDVGFWLYKPATLNLAHALPNKFFEFVQARLAVAVGPTPEMSRYIGTYGFGLVSEDFTPESMARALSGLTSGRIKDYKEKADQCARALSSEPNEARLLSIVADLIGA